MSQLKTGRPSRKQKAIAAVNDTLIKLGLVEHGKKFYEEM